jgi:hypothetical protein
MRNHAPSLHPRSGDHVEVTDDLPLSTPGIRLLSATFAPVGGVFKAGTSGVITSVRAERGEIEVECSLPGNVSAHRSWLARSPTNLVKLAVNSAKFQSLFSTPSLAGAKARLHD